MKYLCILISIFITPAALACSNGGNYTKNWNDSMTLLLLSLSLCMFAVFVKIVRSNQKLFIPVVIFVLTLILPVLDIYDFGNGDCGISLYASSNWSVYVMVLVVVFELIKLSKSRTAQGNT
jgi:hypothetical protein